MGTAFMFYSNKNEWAGGIEGWHGIDQLGEDGANPNYNAMVQRFSKRFGRDRATWSSPWPTTRQGWPSTASPMRPSPAPRGHDGIERIRWMPATNGGPSCYIISPRRPQGLQGRLPDHPRAAWRRPALHRLLPARVAVEPLGADPRRLTFHRRSPPLTPGQETPACRRPRPLGGGPP